MAEVALFARHEQLFLERGRRKLPVPVVIVSGALGSGKTTLLNHVLSNCLNLRVHCIVNDLAALNVDAKLLLKRDAAATTIELTNGCACHSLSGKLDAEIAAQLADCDGAERFDCIVVESSGVVDPVPLVEAISRRFGRLARARLDHVVVVVDADAMWGRLANATAEAASARDECVVGAGAAEGQVVSEEAAGIGAVAVADEAREVAHARDAAAAAAAAAAAVDDALLSDVGSRLEALTWHQLQSADVVLLNKVELLPHGDARRLAAALQRASPWARVMPCSYARVPLHTVLNVSLVSGGGGASHEGKLGEQGMYLTGEEASLFKSASRSGSAIAPAAASVPRPTPLSNSHADGFRAVHFASDVPLQLSGVQDLFAQGLLPPDEDADGRARGGVDTLDPPPPTWTPGSNEGSALWAPASASAKAPAAALARVNFRGLLLHVCRIKGVVWFGECRERRWTLQQSGRHRLELRDGGRWTSPPRCDLVVIGQGWAEAEADALLRALTLLREASGTADSEIEGGDSISVRHSPSGNGGGGHDCEDHHDGGNGDNGREEGGNPDPIAFDQAAWEALQAQRADAEALILADGRFELLYISAAPKAMGTDDEEGVPQSKRLRVDHSRDAGSTRLLHFQIVGTSRHGFSRTCLQDRFGIDVDAMNSDLVTAVNASNPAQSSRNDNGENRLKPVLTAAPLDAMDEHGPQTVSVRFALGGRCSLRDIWSVVSDVADRVLNRACAHVHYCRCDA